MAEACGMMAAMDWAELWQRYRATEAELQTYVSGLPHWVNAWRGWMFAVFGAALVFVPWRSEARWVVLTMVVSLFAYNAVAMASGVGRFPSVAFLAFWTPLALHLARRRSALPAVTRFDRAYAGWVAIALATLVVSLAFDAYNVGTSLLRGVP
jgi:hypothetical protein